MIRIFSVLALGLISVLSSGCSAGDQSAPDMLGLGGSPDTTQQTAPQACADHAEGCPCDEPGQKIECGRVKRISGDYVWCSTGKQVCDEFGAWGKCQGDAAAAASH